MRRRTATEYDTSPGRGGSKEKEAKDHLPGVRGHRPTCGCAWSHDWTSGPVGSLTLAQPAYKVRYSKRNGNGSIVGEGSIEIESIRVKEWGVSVGQLSGGQKAFPRWLQSENNRKKYRIKGETSNESEG